MNFNWSMIKKFWNLDLIIYGAFVGITFLLGGWYMTKKKRKTLWGRLQIVGWNVLFWGGIPLFVYYLI